MNNEASSIDVMTVDFSTLGRILPTVIQQRYPIMFRGLHGVGKSELVYQIADDIGLDVLERRASQMTEGDLLGIPKEGTDEENRIQAALNERLDETLDAEDYEEVKENVAAELKDMGVDTSNVHGKWTKFLPPRWLYIACTRPVCLFIDELDRATLEVRQGFFELGDSRKIYGQNLHEDTLIFAACNSGVGDGMGYQTLNLDPAEADRWTIYDVEPTTDEWLQWAGQQDDIPTAITDFIADHEEHLEETDQYEQGNRYPSRRSWARLGRTLNGTDLIDENPPDLLALAAGFVGPEAAGSFTNYLENYERELKPEDILEEGKWEDTEDWDELDHNNLIKKFRYGQTLIEEDITQEKALNLAEYMVRLGSSPFLLLFQELCKTVAWEIREWGEPEGDEFERVYHANTSVPLNAEEAEKKQKAIEGKGEAIPKADGSGDYKPLRVRDHIVDIMTDDDAEELLDEHMEKLEEERGDEEEEETDAA